MAGFVEVAFSLPLERTFTYSCDTTPQPGCRVIAPFGGRSLHGVAVATHHDAPQGYQVKPLERVLDEEPLLTPQLLELGRWMAGMYFASWGECLGTMIPNAKEERRVPSLGGGDPEPNPVPITPSAAQASAIRCITEGSSGGTAGRYFLYGVTGSGKTEVFLQSAEHILAQGRGIIYLVPEIALTHQVAEMLKSRFGDTAAILHSRMTPSQRLGEWRRIRRGEARMVIGARSAVFAPVQHLGLIILDEEHEGAYKAGDRPRYHARQIAMKRCSSEQATLIMGSATPSVEAKHLMDTGGLQALHLPERISGGGMPALEIVDMRREKESLSQQLRTEIQETLQSGRQVILFLNRRGFSHFFHCRSCGYEMHCPHCSVGLTLHKHRGRMVCHYCGYTTRPIDVCPACKSLDVGYSGFGTEHIEDEVRRHFPQASIDRLDTDSAGRKGVVERILGDFRSGKTDILLGTQMVAKGLNFPGLHLVGIVLADTGLHMPDFRAAERTFTLITQVAGRAGRYHPDGRVLIQTYQPDNPVIRQAAAGDVEGFYRTEIDVRRMTGFPPFSRMIRLVVRGKQEQSVRNAADELSARLHSGGRFPGECMGPSECPLGKIAGNYRMQILLRSRSGGDIHTRLSQVLPGFKLPRGLHLEIDVDPIQLL
ncbi:replication restart helicase PriA [Spirochaeta africana]|uniref:Replication restart protein PriA n=1 Tax=Spirochaeta africana (strain ATCC 700263 / DSM 8902 / Z-7692) TaxID=889378 RepID=H9UI23_SPIAZ|nr:primosomal protein N' [Spirochaeta africana]AFG37166.1 primosomal protein N'' [Spirochaeta africana DSM 8902]